ncbi:MAG: ABC transporter permease subunit [Defluviitaleaceae bacterium]|nr:ABC transporter permease subunit [Defluviitaleaceae bacterium]
MQGRRAFMKKAIRQRELIFMALPIMIYVFIFNYLPLRGWAMAFQNFRPARAALGQAQEWVGFQHFRFLFTDQHFWRIMRNTIAMSGINLVLGFVSAIGLALLINEIRNQGFKRVVQTISYLPHFLSWVIAASLIGDFLAGNGILNQVLMWLGITDQPIIFLANPNNFWGIIGLSSVWKSVGWNTIIYLAAITSIDPALYESAELDGAGRFARMRHVTLPGIKSTILVLIIMNAGWILNAGFELQFILMNDLTRPMAETLDIFVVRWGINQGNFSLATAAGMFRTVVSIFMITAANQLSKRIARESLV